MTDSPASRPTHIADKSALARLRHPGVSAALAPMIDAGRLATCGVLELEVLYSARDRRDFSQIREELQGYPRLAIEQADFDRAIDLMAALARRGQHRAAGLPDLLLAAVAERHGVTLLHYDADFDLIAPLSSHPILWVAPRGSVP